MDNSISMLEDQKFSVRGRLRSFYYAGAGLKKFFGEEHNARIHLAAAIVAGILGWWCKVSHTEALALVIVIGLVWVTEILNTCIERAMDFITRETRPEIKLIKDLAAGAVLIASLTAVIVGAFIFIPKFL